ncbi:MAG: hypothetical protein R2912_02560 [Eubacteriales bacterium]
MEGRIGYVVTSEAGCGIDIDTPDDYARARRYMEAARRRGHRPMNATAIIMAAGEPRQMNHFQPMLKLSGKSVIRRQIESFRAAGIDD